MGAKGEIKVSKQSEGFQQLCGLALIEEIVAINPTKEEKAKLFGYDLNDDAEDIVYTGKNDDGKDKLDLDIYFRISGDFPVRKQRFFMENTFIEFEDEETGVVKHKYVNQVGQTTVVEEGADLPDWFTHFQEWDDDQKKYVNIDETKTTRRCLKGEDGLMRFLREALSINYESPSADLAYNYKKLFTGNVKEFLSDLQGDLFRPFIVMHQVTTSQDGENFYEKLYLPNNNFGVPTLSAEMMKFIQNGNKFPKGRLKKKWDKYVVNHTNYPPVGYAPLEPVRVYDSSEDVAAGNSSKKEEKKKAVATADDDDDY